MSHHSTSHHHCTTFHITLLHTNVPRHISQTVNVATRLASDHQFYIWEHYTAISHHHISKYNIFHITATVRIAPFDIHNYSTPYIKHRSILHIALHHHIWQHIASFSTSVIAQHIAHTRTPHSTPRHIPLHTFCISIRHHVWNCNIPHRTTFDIYWSHHISHLGAPFHIMPT